MSDPKKNTIPVHASEIEVGRPLRWAVYDGNGVLLLKEGMAPATQTQIAAMIERGLFRQAGTDIKQNGSRPDIPPMGLGPRDNDKANPAGDPVQFDDLALQPGEILQMHFALEVVGTDMLAVLIGYLKSRAIVVATPIVSGKPLLVKDGELFNVKTFSGTSLFTFRTRVLISHIQPMPHLHLEYPRLVYATKIRRTLRALVDLPATLQDPVSGNCLNVILKDLSAGGAKLVLPEPVACPQNARFLVSFKVRIGDDFEEEIKADVVMRGAESRTEKGGTVHTMGVQFRDLSKSASLAIMALVYRQQLRKG